MKYEYPGYNLHLIQKQGCHDASAHLFTLICKFYSPVTHYHYIVRAEYDEGDFFGLKFYCKKDRHSDYKYSKIVNKGDLMNILITCLKAIPLILKDYPTASFGFIGARSVDRVSKTFEPYQKTQRYRIYTQLIMAKVGQQTFEHIAYEEVSGYLLINRKVNDITDAESLIRNIVYQTYEDLLDI